MLCCFRSCVRKLVPQLTQTAGRAARNSNGRVIMYADKITKSMQLTIDETNRRRAIQIAYNEKHGIIPKTVHKSREEIIKSASVLNVKGEQNYYEESGKSAMAADPVVQYMTKAQLEKAIKATEKMMKAAAKELNFIEAAQYRDELFALKKTMRERFS